MATARTRPADGEGQDNPVEAQQVDAQAPKQAKGDHTNALADDGPGDPVKLATARAAKKAQAGSSTTPIAGESVVVGTDGKGSPVAVASHPAPSHSSEVQVAAAEAVLRSSYEGLVDEDGNELSGDVFEDRHPGGGMVYTTKRVFKTQMMPHSQRPTSVLVYPANAAVPRGEAEAFKNATSK